MRIECLTTFLDGAERFEKGDMRTVDDDRAQRFIAHGWAVVPGEEPVKQTQGNAALSVKDSAIGTGDSNG